MRHIPLAMPVATPRCVHRRPTDWSSLGAHAAAFWASCPLAQGPRVSTALPRNVRGRLLATSLNLCYRVFATPQSCARACSRRAR